MSADGKFGGTTRTAARRFQRAHGLQASGVLDRRAWKALGPHLRATVGRRDADVARFLRKFRGDLEWVHEQEGYRGRPYWPGGVSGVTLDPGVDLGHVSSWSFIEELYGSFLTKKQMSALRTVFGFKGDDARAALRASAVIRAIRISDERALAIMPRSAAPYWNGVSRRFKALLRKDTPPSVQTALLSLAYNRGSQNRHLRPLGPLLSARKWATTARRIASMQQSHKLKGIRLRRRREGALIRAELDFLAS